MTSPLHGEGRQFESGWAHTFLIKNHKKYNRKTEKKEQKIIISKQKYYAIVVKWYNTALPRIL